MPADGIARLFVAVVATIGGSVLLSGLALLALEQRALSDAQPPPAATASAAAGDATPAASPAASAGEASVPAGRADVPDASSTAAAEPAVSATPTSASLAVSEAGSTPTPTATPTAEAPADEVQYVVVRGDALELIAARFGVPLATLAARNNLQPPYTLAVGQVLSIPSGP